MYKKIIILQTINPSLYNKLLQELYLNKRYPVYTYIIVWNSSDKK